MDATSKALFPHRPIHASRLIRDIGPEVGPRGEITRLRGAFGADHILRPPTKDTTTIGLLKEVTRGRLRMVRALCTDVNAAIDASLQKHRLLAVRNGDGHRPLGPGSKKWDIPL